MFRPIFSFFAITAVAFSFLLSPNKAMACEDPPPTLLALYRASSEIHIARYEGEDRGGIVEQGDDYVITDVHKRFSIISSLKGSHQGSFVSTEQQYRYTGGEAVDGEDAEHGHDPEKLEAGDTVLLFLKRSSEDNKLVLSNYQGAAKKLSDKVLASYTKAIEELNSIHAMRQGQDEALVEWLVQRAVDPNTRREGAYELLTGFQTIDWKEMQERQIKEKLARGEELEEWEKPGYEEPYEDSVYFDNTPYARKLTDKQKAILLDLAMTLKPEKLGDSEYITFNEGDSHLIELASRWGDERYAGFLLEQAREKTYYEYARYQFISQAASILKDDEAKTLAEEYGNVYYYEDTDKIEDRLAESGPPAVTVTVKPGSTFGDLKNAILERFFSRCGKVLATSGKTAAS